MISVTTAVNTTSVVAVKATLSSTPNFLTSKICLEVVEAKRH